MNAFKKLSNLEALQYLSPPLIITGCHRSGTSIVTKYLSQNGVFMGNDQYGHSESKFFQTLNQEILQVCDANWSSIENAIKTLNEENNTLKIEKLLKIANRNPFGKYLSIRKFLRLLIENKNALWGWKDPRNTITLNVWLSIFPESKILHIHRHGYDVALSLLNRELKRNRNDELFSRNLLNFVSCLDLWYMYEMFFLEELKPIIKPQNLLILSYEDFMQNPTVYKYQLEAFLNMKLMVGTEDILHKTSIFKYAQKENEDFIRDKMIDRRYQMLLKRLGYATI